MSSLEFALSVDLEVTNRCNAKCHFCPRDQTPHQGLMTPEVFEQSLARAVEFRALALDRLQLDVRVSLSGLGEPLLNRNVVDYVRQVRAAGLECGMSSNGALLDEERSRALLDAGLQRIFLNVGEKDEDYESIYQLPFERTCENVIRFAKMAGEQCDVFVVLVDHRGDRDHLQDMQRFWKDRGIENFWQFDIMNRGGALFVDHMQFESLPQSTEARSLLGSDDQLPLCGAPFGYLFIGYDGHYYLCCSDWKKEVPLGSVFETSFQAIVQPKLERVLSREPICKSCNLDPLNQLTDELRAIDDGVVAPGRRQQLVDELAERSEAVLHWIEALDPGASDAARRATRTTRRRIPVTAL